MLPAALAAAGALVVLALAPPSADLAAQAFRADLFSRAGFTVVSTAWYGGHHTPAYSVLFPPLGALLGVGVVGALSCVVSSALVGALAGRRCGLAFVPAMLATVVSGRVTFALGVAFGLAAVLASVRSRVGLALVLGILTALASPVAALFAGLVGAALAGARAAPRGAAGRAVAAGVALGVGVAVPTAVLVLAFPEGGTFPFAVSAFVPAFLAGVAVALVAPRGSALQIGGALYALLCLVALVVPSPVGGNATRLGVLLAVPVAVHLLWPHRRGALAVLALLLAYWVAQPAVRDVVRASGDPSVEAAFHAPLLAALERERGPVRVEIPLTQNKGETHHLAREVPIARGWERQLDRERNALFYEDGLTRERYVAWLRENAVTHVALPLGVPLDPEAREERRLVERGLPELREIARPGRWRLFAVTDTEPLGATAIGPESFTVRAPAEVRIRWSPYWAVVRGRGCVARTTGDWTRVTGTGVVTVGARFGLGRIRATARRCTEPSPNGFPAS